MGLDTICCHVIDVTVPIPVVTISFKEKEYSVTEGATTDLYPKIKLVRDKVIVQPLQNTGDTTDS